MRALARDARALLGQIGAVRALARRGALGVGERAAGELELRGRVLRHVRIGARRLVGCARLLELRRGRRRCRAGTKQQEGKCGGAAHRPAARSRSASA